MMNKDLHILSWNLRDGINNPEISRSIIDIEPDVAVFPEAASEDEAVSGETINRFRKAGYELYQTAYKDIDGRLDRHTLAVIVKPELSQNVASARLLGRTAIMVTMQNGVEFLGVHLDDRNEPYRLLQAKAAIKRLGDRAIVAGDFNATHREGLSVRTLRTIKPLTHMLPARDPGQPMSKLQRIGSLGQRLTDMASGTTMTVFTEAGFSDASKDRAPTMTIGPLGVQLDHILYRGGIQPRASTVVEDGDGLSDHKRIRATLDIA